MTPYHMTGSGSAMPSISPEQIMLDLCNAGKSLPQIANAAGVTLEEAMAFLKTPICDCCADAVTSVREVTGWAYGTQPYVQFWVQREQWCADCVHDYLPSSERGAA